MEKWQMLSAIVIAVFGSTGFWSWLSQRKVSNKAIMEKLSNVEGSISNLETSVDKLEYSVDRNAAVSCRSRILRFNKELIKKERHTHEEFTTILEDVDVYERFTREHPDFRNNFAVLSIENIKRCYQLCEEQHDFL